MRKNDTFCMHTMFASQVAEFLTYPSKMSTSVPNFRSILHMTAEEAKEFCTTNNLTPFAVYEEPARLIVPDTMESTPNRAEIEYYLGINDVYRVGKAIIYRDGIQVADVKPIPNFRPILHMTAEEANKFCASNKFKPCIVYAEPSHITTYSDKVVRDRVELDLYLDATDTHRVGKAIIYQDGIQVAVVEPDECDKCGGECDGVHATSKPSSTPAAPTAPKSLSMEKEKRVEQLVNAIVKNEKSIVDEVIRQMDAKRVIRIMEVLSVQDPDVVMEVVGRLKGVGVSVAPGSTYNSAEDMRNLWKSYGK